MAPLIRHCRQEQTKPATMAPWIRHCWLESTIPFERLFALSTATNTRGHAAKIAKHNCHLDLRRFSSQSVLSTVGTTCHSKILAAVPSTPSRIVLTKFVIQRWASLWTNRSAWPFGLICAKFIWDQVRPHLVSYLVSNTCTLRSYYCS